MFHNRENHLITDVPLLEMATPLSSIRPKSSARSPARRRPGEFGCLAIKLHFRRLPLIILCSETSTQQVRGVLQDVSSRGTRFCVRSAPRTSSQTSFHRSEVLFHRDIVPFSTCIRTATPFFPFPTHSRIISGRGRAEGASRELSAEVSFPILDSRFSMSTITLSALQIAFAGLPRRRHLLSSRKGTVAERRLRYPLTIVALSAIKFYK